MEEEEEVNRLISFEGRMGEGRGALLNSMRAREDRRGDILVDSARRCDHAKCMAWY